MNIAVCVKQVPAVSEVSIDPETKRLIREGVEAVLNPFDLYAVEAGIQLREQLGGVVTAISMGPRKAEWSVRESIAIGTDRGILLNDRAFGGSDTWATSYALACAIRTLETIDLVICGKQAVDGDTAQVGPGIAAHLDWPQVTYVSSVSEATDESITVRRMHEDGTETVKLMLPAVITVVKDTNVPRVPTLRNVLESRRAEIPFWSPADINTDPALLGLDGSPTRVVKTEPPPPRNKETVLLDGTPRETARRVIHDLRMQSLV